MTTYPLKIAMRRQETADTASFWFDVPRDLRTAFTYRTGQFIAIESNLGGETVTRQYSLASVPGLDERLWIIVKRIPGGRMSTWLVGSAREGDVLAHGSGLPPPREPRLVGSAREGDVLEVAAPRGRLYAPADTACHYLLLAAGSGIVPLLAVARHAAGQAVGHQVTLAYGNRQAESIIARDEVDALQSQGVAVEHVLSQPYEGWAGRRGHVDSGYLADRWADWAGSPLPIRAFLCGPADFMSAAEAFLVARGVSINDIRKESFDLVLNDDEGDADLIVPEEYGQAEPEDCGTLTAIVSGEEIRVTPEPGEPLLAALLRVSDEVPYSCQEGTCASCIVKLTQGQVSVRPGVLQTLRPADLEDGLILACLSRARTKTVRIDFDDI